MEYSIIKNYNNKILISISYIINTKFNKKSVEIIKIALGQLG